jgi:hypothetical protein
MLRMNRTLAYASFHTKDALRSSTRIPNCWTCIVSRNHSQWVQSHVLRPSVSIRQRQLSPSVRLLSKQRVRKQIVLGYRQRLPLLLGESAPPPRRSKDEIRKEQSVQRRTTRVSTEQARLQQLQSKPAKDPKQKSEKSFKRGKLPRR